MAEDFFVAGHTPVRRVKTILAQVINGTINQPAGTYIGKIVMRNKTANAVTGGIRIGTTAAGVDIAATIAVAASAWAVAQSLIPAYSAAARLLYVEAVTAWNSASVDTAIEFFEVT